RRASLAGQEGLAGQCHWRREDRGKEEQRTQERRDYRTGREGMIHGLILSRPAQCHDGAASGGRGGAPDDLPAHAAMSNIGPRRSRAQRGVAGAGATLARALTPSHALKALHILVLPWSTRRPDPIAPDSGISPRQMRTRSGKVTRT